MIVKNLCNYLHRFFVCLKNFNTFLIYDSYTYFYTNYKFMEDNLTKKCSLCKKEKNITEFYKSKSGSLGVCGKCKNCEKEYRKNKKSHYSKLAKSYRQKNKEKYKEYSKKYYQENKEYLKEYSKEYLKKYSEENKDRLNIYKKKYNKEYYKKRRNSDPLFKLKANLRSRIWHFLKKKKSKRTEHLLGASYEVVKKHIESTFQEGMTWQNYGEWHVDHKIPLSSANSVEEVEKLFHYTNLQPLWAFDNLSKGSKII